MLKNTAVELHGNYKHAAVTQFNQSCPVHALLYLSNIHKLIHVL